MIAQPTFFQWTDVKAADLRVAMSTDKNGKPQLRMTLGPDNLKVAFVTCPCVTQWPRCSGDGNYGTLWGPSEISKARYTLDLTDLRINGNVNAEFDKLAALFDAIDDKLLDFVHNDQVRILGRKSLSRDEVKMLQIRTVKAKYDRDTGAHLGYSINLNMPKFQSDGMGGKYERKVNVCDHTGKPLAKGVVCPGDVVAATISIGTVYTGVSGDKFGLSWHFHDVAVICQRAKMVGVQTQVAAFQSLPQYDFAMEYDEPDEGFSNVV